MKTRSKLSKRKKFLYALLALMVLGVVGVFGGYRYFIYRVFVDRPNTLTIEGDLHPVAFEWSEDTYGSYTEPHSGILFPVLVPGIDKQLYMQFDTGSPSTFLRSGAMKSLQSRGIEFELFEEDDETRVRKFELNIGGNRVILNSGEVMAREIAIDWDNPEAKNIIGSIGADFIDQRICEIDFAAQEIRLYKNRPAGMNALGAFTPFKFKGRRIILPAVIDGVELELFYDSGCSAFGLLTSKYHFERYADQNSKEINYNANRFGDPVFVHHKPCKLSATFGGVEVPLERVSYVELYTTLQNTVGRFINGGFFGNKSLTQSTFILDGKAREFLIVP